AFPSYLGAQQVRIADLAGDGRNEVIVLSDKESAVGISRRDEGRLTLPVTLDLEGTPEALDTVEPPVAGGLPAGLLVLVNRGGYALASVRKGEDGSWKQVPIAGEKTLLEFKLNGSPESIQYRDLDGDGQPELLVTLTRGREPQVF